MCGEDVLEADCSENGTYDLDDLFLVFLQGFPEGEIFARS